MTEDDIIVHWACEEIKANLRRIAENNKRLAEIEQKEKEE